MIAVSDLHAVARNVFPDTIGNAGNVEDEISQWR